MSSSSSATFQYGFVQFGQADYNLLLGIMVILVALGLIIVFTVKEAQGHNPKEVTPAPVAAAPTAVATSSAAKPKKTAAKAVPVKEEPEEEPEEVEEKPLSTPKKRAVSSTRRRKSDDALGFITSPEGTRASARLATKTPGK